MKTLAKIILIVAAFAAGVYVGGNPALAPSDGQSKIVGQTAANASIMLDYGDGTLATFNDLAVTATTTVFDLLKQVASQSNMVFEYKDYGDLGVMVERIGEKTNDLKNDRYWQFWVNNKYSSAGASAYVVSPGDTIEWKYTKGQFVE